MFRKGCLALLLLLLSVGAAYAIDIDELVAKVPAANGGEAAVRNMKSYQMTGTMTMQFLESADIEFKQHFKRPNKFRMDFTIMGESTTLAYDSEIAWKSSSRDGGEPEEIDAESMKSAALQSNFFRHVRGLARAGDGSEIAW